VKKPFVNKEQLEKIASEYATPFYLYDEKGIRENARKVMQAFAWNKGFKEYFAVKATPNPRLLQILREEGCGADCSSYTELLMADAVGFKESEIMFSSFKENRISGIYLKMTLKNEIKLIELTNK